MIIIDGKEYENTTIANHRLLSGDVSNYEFPDLSIKSLKISDFTRENIPKFIGKNKRLTTSVLEIDSRYVEIIPKNIESFKIKAGAVRHLDLIYFGDNDLAQHNQNAYREIGLVKIDLGEESYKLLESSDITMSNMKERYTQLENVSNFNSIPLDVLIDNADLILFFSEIEIDVNIDDKFMLKESIIPYLGNKIFKDLHNNTKRITNLNELLNKKYINSLSIEIYMKLGFSVKDLFELFGDELFTHEMIFDKILKDKDLSFLSRINRVSIETLLNSKDFLKLEVILDLFENNKIYFSNYTGNETYKDLFLSINNNPVYSSKEVVYETQKRLILFLFS